MKPGCYLGAQRQGEEKESNRERERPRDSPNSVVGKCEALEGLV